MKIHRLRQKKRLTSFTVGRGVLARGLYDQESVVAVLYFGLRKCTEKKGKNMNQYYFSMCLKKGLNFRNTLKFKKSRKK